MNWKLGLALSLLLAASGGALGFQGQEDDDTEDLDEENGFVDPRLWAALYGGEQEGRSS